MTVEMDEGAWNRMPHLTRNTRYMALASGADVAEWHAEGKKAATHSTAQQAASLGSWEVDDKSTSQ